MPPSKPDASTFPRSQEENETNGAKKRSSFAFTAFLLYGGPASPASGSTFPSGGSPIMVVLFDGEPSFGGSPHPRTKVKS